MKKVFIYSLKHPITDEVRYVGRTVNLKHRYKQHISDKRQTHKRSWIESLLKENLKPIIEVLEVCDDITWEDREIYWITQFDNLTNHKPGGNGGSDYIRVTKEETGRKISDVLKGRKLSEDHKNNLEKSAPNKRKISINNVEYNSIMEASKIISIPKSSIHFRLNSDKHPGYQYIDI